MERRDPLVVQIRQIAQPQHFAQVGSQLRQAAARGLDPRADDEIPFHLMAEQGEEPLGAGTPGPDLADEAG